ncbi:MAG: diheme cytochrome c [Burkholderiaceae bacterium]|nr:diheme cytochrome c [Burkholderiaceae bacterium]
MPAFPTTRCRPLPWALGLLLTLPAAFGARADPLAVPTLPAYQQECAACHLAYPPGLLPAASWQRLMAGLPHHFGSDASLDAATQQSLSAWLTANAGSYKKVARDPAPPPEDRISKAPWFVREHREVSAATWRRKSIGSASNCAACHGGAAQGRFSEHDLRIPQ